MFSGIGVRSWDRTILPILTNPIGVCDPTPIQLFFDMWDRRIVRSYDPDPNFNNLGSNGQNKTVTETEVTTLFLYP